MTYVLKGLVGRGATWTSAFDALSLPCRRLPIDAAGEPLFLVRPRALSEVDTMQMLDQMARDDPELPSPFPELAASATDDRPLAVAGAEFTGGTGFQWSAAWSRDRLLFGPLITATDPAEAEDERFVVVPPEGMAINRLLRWLGARARPGADEFDTAGLGRSRGERDDPPVR